MDIPVTSPPATVATDVLLLLQVPPITPSAKEIFSPMHTLDGPVIAPGDGGCVTVMGLDATSVPQVLETVYVIITEPAVTPVTMPPAVTVALVLLALHVPPGVASLRVILLVLQTEDGPVMVAATGTSSTVTGTAAMAIPQVLVTV